jgi:hypothetical protein
MNNKVVLILVALSAFCGGSLLAQDKKDNAKKEEEEKIPVFNYIINDPMDVFGRNPEPDYIASLLFPEFYSYKPIRKKDTVYQYLCYDMRDSLINVDTLHSIYEVRYISVFQQYTDNLHTYKDAQGVEKPLPVSKIIYRYDKVGNDKWMSIDYSTNKYTKLKEDMGEIVRSDTVTVTHPVTGVKQPRINRYYKVKKSK